IFGEPPKKKPPLPLRLAAHTVGRTACDAYDLLISHHIEKSLNILRPARSLQYLLAVPNAESLNHL
ncbi:MAG: hypothetical protein KAS19_09750, partial [Anaerolineales bacterium]|nr:hypothetical protein [Anaerolineales bacterium]